MSMLNDIDQTVGIRFSTDDGETWQDFDSGETFNEAFVRTLELFQEDDNANIKFLFVDVMGEPMAILGRTAKYPDIAVLTYAGDQADSRFYRVRYVDRAGRVATEVTSINITGKPLGPATVIG